MKLGWTGFSLLLFYKMIYREQEILNVWVDMSERNSGYMWQFPDHDSLCLQVSGVRFSWWSLEEALCSPECCWDSPVQPLDSPSVIILWVC
jgi:hypothetical protein